MTQKRKKLYKITEKQLQQLKNLASVPVKEPAEPNMLINISLFFASYLLFLLSLFVIERIFKLGIHFPTVFLMSLYHLYALNITGKAWKGVRYVFSIFRKILQEIEENNN